MSAGLEKRSGSGTAGTGASSMDQVSGRGRRRSSKILRILDRYSVEFVLLRNRNDIYLSASASLPTSRTLWPASMYSTQALPTSAASSPRLDLRLLRRQSSNAESSRSSAASLATAVLKPGVGAASAFSVVTSLPQVFCSVSRYFGSLHSLKRYSTSAWPSLILSTPGTAQCRKRS